MLQPADDWAMESGIMQFGVFDHLDLGSVPLGEHYENRLQLIEAYDRAGLRTYHLAEHHATPLGLAPSPSVFLAAVAQRTRQLRFGPLVYTLSLHHPLRVAEEICMLDHMSGGRLELGVGRGVSPYEVAYFGVDPAKAQAMYVEALSVILKALSSRTLDFAGEHYTFRDVPIELEPVQRPHPPLWYGLARPEGLPWVVANRVNIVCNGPPSLVRQVTDGYRQAWAAGGNGADTLPLMGMTRTIVVADSDAEAQGIARRAHKRWHRSFMQLWNKHGSRPINAFYPDNFEEVQQAGFGFAGTSASVCDALAAQIAETGVNYLVCRFAFGDMALAESQRSLELFARQVMPALA
jgi:alkanesulfonate monooxygenase SsuD/methylene tetrahydromethanopterin reductase-like flavin-dependent oxidoreductase (luciferase family)